MDSDKQLGGGGGGGAADVDVAWHADRGGEFQDVVVKPGVGDGIAFLTVRDLADPDKVDFTRQHRDRTVQHRMLHPHGKYLTDTLQSDGKPYPGTGNDPSKPKEAQGLQYTALKRPSRSKPSARNSDGHSATSSRGSDRRRRQYPVDPYMVPLPQAAAWQGAGLTPQDSVTQRQRVNAAVHAAKRAERGRTASSHSDVSHGGSSHYSTPSQQRADKPSFGNMVRNMASERTPPSRHKERSSRHSSSSSHGREERDAVHALPRARRRGYVAMDDILDESMGDATVLEQGAIAFNPASRYLIKRKQRMAQASEQELRDAVRRRRKREGRARDRREQLRAAGRPDDAVSRVSTASSEWNARDQEEADKRELALETRVQYTTYLHQQANAGYCEKPDPQASELEIRTMFESVVCHRDRIKRIKKASIIVVTLAYVIEMAIRAFRLPVRAEGLGLFLQKNFETKKYDDFLEHVYQTRLAKYGWTGHTEMIFSMVLLLASFFYAKYQGGGDGVDLPEKDNHNEPASLGNSLTGFMKIFGGMPNIMKMGMNGKDAMFPTPTGMNVPPPSTADFAAAKQTIQAAAPPLPERRKLTPRPRAAQAMPIPAAPSAVLEQPPDTSDDDVA
jgi:hypothetical protein